VQPAAQNAFLYGFGIQAGLAAVLWLLVRLGRTPLSFPSLALAGTALWNVGLLIGVLFLHAGDSTGYLWLDMPRAASTLLFIAYERQPLPPRSTISRIGCRWARAYCSMSTPSM